MGKSVTYFAKWVKFLPISCNGQFHRLGVTYTHVNVPQILLKKKKCYHSLVDVHVKGVFFQQEGHYLNIKEQFATSYRPHRELIWMQGTHFIKCIIWHVQTLQVNGEHLQH